MVYMTLSDEYRSQEVVLQLCQSYVMPYLKNCVQFWSLHCTRLERAWKSFTKMLPGLENINYREIG